MIHCFFLLKNDASINRYTIRNDGSPVVIGTMVYVDLLLEVENCRMARRKSVTNIYELGSWMLLVVGGR